MGVRHIVARRAPALDLLPSDTPLHSDQWIGRAPTPRELSEEFRNVYRVLREIRELLERLLEEDDDGGDGP